MNDGINSIIYKVTVQRNIQMLIESGGFTTGSLLINDDSTDVSEDNIVLLHERSIHG